MAEFKLGRLRFVWKGAWVTGTAYVKDDIIRYGGKSYVALLGHTANADFYVDLTANKWQLMTDGVEWKNQWTPSTYYKLNDIVRFGAKDYICVLGHTSDATANQGFYTDLTANKWQLMSDGQQWRGAWNVSTYYRVGDIVRYGGKDYITVIGHTSDSSASGGFYTDLTANKWELYTDGQQWKGNWTPTTYYKVGDLVRYGGRAYLCNAGHTSQGTLELDQLKWDVFINGFDWQSLWQQGNVYKVNDVVKYGGDIWICETAHTAQALFDENNFALLVNGLQFEDSWTNSESYQIGDVVTYGGYSYVSKTTNNVNNVPSTSTANWEVLTTGFSIKADWDTVTAYKTGDVVRYGGYVYVAKVDNTNVNPAATPTQWDLLTQGFDWKGLWSSGTTYKLGDAVAYGPNSYICVLEHNSIVGNRPDNDLSGTYWNSLVNGAETNVLTTRGDLVYYAQSGVARLPVGEDGQVLRVNQGDPAWAYWGILNNVYYVAPTGTDDEEHGLSMDKPWRTIQHACNKAVSPATIYVKSGTYSEVLPIVVPTNVSIVGDELRTVIVQPAGSVVSAGSVPYQLAGINRIKALISNIVQNIAVTPTLGNALTQDTSISPAGSAGAGTAAIALLQNAYDQIDKAINNTGSYPTLAGSNTATVDSGYIQAVAILEANRNFLGAEAVAFINNTYKASCTATATNGNITCDSTANLAANMPIRFSGTVFGGIASNTTYYVKNILGLDTFTVSSTPGGTTLTWSATSGTMTATYYYDTAVLAKDIREYVEAIKYDLTYTGNYKTLVNAKLYVNSVLGSTTQNMFHLRDSSILRNMTFKGLIGTLGDPNAYNTRRPTGGAYVSLDSGFGPSDTFAQITNKSPYVQNCSSFGTAAVGLKVDGALHNAGNKSIVCNDYTNVISDGIAIWCTNLGRVEAVSVFSYYGYMGYLSENGGKIRATNGNSSYGTYGCVSEGVDNSETPKIALVNNRAFEARVGFVLTDQNAIQWLEYTNAGQSYTTATYSIGGSGIAAAVSAVNTFNQAVCEVRIVNGGSGYVTVTNNAQTGNTTQITLSAADSAATNQYNGMRIIIVDGKGSGQYGYIDSFNGGTKVATIRKESDDSPGWDVAVSGTLVSSVLDSTTRYVIEPRVSFSGTGSGTLARAVVNAGIITSIRIINPGSGYTSSPSMTITDPNKTSNGTYTVMVANGVLGQPTWSNRGTGYKTAVVTIDGDGFADSLQTGVYVNVNGLSLIPRVGANVVFSGNSVVYKLVSVTSVTGTPGSYNARFQISPGLTVTDVPAHGDSVTIREQYSQVRLTGHDFLSVGSGNITDTNYPGLPLITPNQLNETLEKGGGRVFFTSTDQDGNFRVGSLFTVEQATGIATLNADAFNLSGLNQLQLGSVNLGGTGAIITEFSTDGTFTANSDNILPTQRAIKTYIASQLGAGGSNITANSLKAGNVYVAGDSITTVNGADLTVRADTGSKVLFTTTADVTGTMNIANGGTLNGVAGSTVTFNGTTTQTVTPTTPLEVPNKKYVDRTLTLNNMWTSSW